MNTRYLFPNSYKKFGWGLLIIAIVSHVILIITGINEIPGFDVRVLAIASADYGGHSGYFRIISHNETNDIIAIFAIIGAILTAFSKEKIEDEYISKIRLDSLLWATYINYAILLLAIIFIYEFAFLYIMMYNMFTLLIIFIIRFNYILYKTKRAAEAMSNEQIIISNEK